MSVRSNWLVRLVLSLLAAGFVAGCSTASYSVKTNKAPGFTGHISRVAVWSGIDNVSLLSQRKALGMSDTFSNFFSAALKTDLASAGATADVHPFSPGTDKLEDLIRFEQEFSPEYRLMIMVPQYHTISSRGVTNVLDMKLDISLFTIKDNRRVWRSELLLDGGIIPGLTWRETGARRLAEDMVNLLKKDNLVN